MRISHMTKLIIFTFLSQKRKYFTIMYQAENKALVKIISYANNVEYNHENLLEDLEKELSEKCFIDILEIASKHNVSKLMSNDIVFIRTFSENMEDYDNFVCNIKDCKTADYEKFQNILSSRIIKKDFVISNSVDETERLKEEN